MTGEKLPRERGVKLWLDGQEYHTFYCTPRELGDLAVGCLFGKGLLVPGRLPSIQVSEGEPWTVRVRTGEGPLPAAPSGEVPSPWQPVPLAELVSLAERAMAETPLRRESGGVHAAALGWGGDLRNGPGFLVREDVARHNAVDKVIGAGIIKGVDLGSVALFTTGRLSHEMITKAAAAGIPIVATMKYPTDLGVSLAARKGMCLAGGILSPQPKVYTGGWRLGLPEDK